MVSWDHRKSSRDEDEKVVNHPISGVTSMEIRGNLEETRVLPPRFDQRVLQISP